MDFKRFNGSTWETVRHKIYGSGTDSLTAFPAVIQASGEPLTDYLISGNTVQDGTPSAEAPVDVVGCGERSENIADLILGKVPRISDGTLVAFDGLTCEYVPITSMSDTFSLTFDKPESAKSFYVYFYSGDTLLSTKDLNYGTTITTYGVPSTVDRMRIRIDYNGTTVSNVMLAKGNNPPPYEPYGYKLPLTVNGTEYPIYLGQVETTRRVKRLVLTGEESWDLNASGSLPFFYTTLSDSSIIGTDVISTHFPSANVGQSTTEIGIGLVGAFQLRVRPYDPTSYTLYSWKEWLSANQPTIWYVLATPETAVVNEPLMKIGDYAGTISMTQAGVTIPTSDGDNTISFGTTVQPSGMSATFKGWHPVQGAKQYDGSEWR